MSGQNRGDGQAQGPPPARPRPAPGPNRGQLQGGTSLDCGTRDELRRFLASMSADYVREAIDQIRGIVEALRKRAKENNHWFAHEFAESLVRWDVESISERHNERVKQ